MRMIGGKGRDGGEEVRRSRGSRRGGGEMEMRKEKWGKMAGHDNKTHWCSVLVLLVFPFLSDSSFFGV
jgi:hypothetical protein